jgi:hypothetical protein
MAFSALLTSLLVEGATLLATSAAGEFAKGAGKAAWEGLKARLAATHGAKSLALVEQAPATPAFKDAIAADLSRPEVAQDPEVHRLATALQAAIAALPKAELAAAAIDADTIRARGDQLFRDVQGIRARLIESDGNQTFEGIRSPGNP